MRITKEQWENVKETYETVYKLDMSFIKDYLKKNKVYETDKYDMYISKTYNSQKRKIAKANQKRIEILWYCDPKIWGVAQRYSLTKVYARYCQLFKTSVLTLEKIEKFNSSWRLTGMCKSSTYQYYLKLKRLLKSLEKEGNKEEENKALLYAAKKTNDFKEAIRQADVNILNKDLPDYITDMEEVIYIRNMFNLVFKIYESHYINYKDSKEFIE